MLNISEWEGKSKIVGCLFHKQESPHNNTSTSCGELCKNVYETKNEWQCFWFWAGKFVDALATYWELTYLVRSYGLSSELGCKM